MFREEITHENNYDTIRNMDDLKKMTKAQLIEQLLRARELIRNEPCGCCGMTRKKWEETPLLDPVDPEPLVGEGEPIFVPTAWTVSGDIEESEDDDEDEDE